MGVRDEHRVEAAERLRVHANLSPEVRDPVTKDGVRQKPDPVQVDRHRRVPDVLDAHAMESCRSRYTQSFKACASGRPSSFFSVLFSICRIRSRVTPNARPTSSSVHGCDPSSP